MTKADLRTRFKEEQNSEKPRVEKCNVEEKLIGFNFRTTKKAVNQIKSLSIEEDRKVYELMNEAMNLIFQKYGKPTIAYTGEK